MESPEETATFAQNKNNYSYADMQSAVTINSKIREIKEKYPSNSYIFSWRSGKSLVLRSYVRQKLHER